MLYTFQSYCGRHCLYYLIETTYYTHILLNLSSWFSHRFRSKTRFPGIFSNGPVLVHLAYHSINSHIFASKSSTTSSKLGLKSCFTTGPFLRYMAKSYGRALPQILALQQEYGLYRKFSAVFIFCRIAYPLKSLYREK